MLQMSGAFTPENNGGRGAGTEILQRANHIPRETRIAPVSRTAQEPASYTKCHTKRHRGQTKRHHRYIVMAVRATTRMCLFYQRTGVSKVHCRGFKRERDLLGHPLFCGWASLPIRRTPLITCGPTLKSLKS